MRTNNDKRQLEYVAPANLVPYARNSRAHSQSQISEIAASIKEFGFTNPVLIDEENVIIAGHGRVKAALLLGLGQVPCVRLSGLTATQRKAYIIADNKIATNASWDDELLKLELADLAEANYDLSLLGWGDELPDFTAAEMDYSVLDENGDMSQLLDAMASEVKKAIQIEFDQEDYEEARTLVKFWREQGAYIGALVIEKLRSEKAKLS